MSNAESNSSQSKVLTTPEEADEQHYKEILNKILEELRGVGFTDQSLSKFAVVLLGGGEQVAGEIISEVLHQPDPYLTSKASLSDTTVRIRNPKRFLRQRVQVPGRETMVSFSYAYSDFDLIYGGTIDLYITGGFWILSDLNAQSAAAYMGLLLDWNKGRMMERASKANIEMPSLIQRPSLR
jgi:hypothetical protein